MPLPPSMKTLIASLPLMLAAGLLSAQTESASRKTPISPLWKSEAFQRTVTGSYGIDSRIEPLITTDEEEYLFDAAKLLAEEDREGAIALYEGASILPQSPAMIFSLANLYYEEGEIERAIERFREAIEAFPNFRDAHRNLAMALTQSEKWEEAEESLIRAVELGARDGATLGLLGYCHAEDEDYQAALQSYRQAQITMPDEMQWKLGEAHALQALGETTSAIGLYRALLKDLPADSSLWLNLAYSLQQSGDARGAVARIEVVRAMEAAMPSDLVTLGHLYLDQSLPDESLAAYLEALEGESLPTANEVVTALGYLVEYSHWDQANQLVAAMETRFPDLSHEKLPRLLALIEFETGDPEKAISAVEELTRSDPTDGQSLLVLARFYRTKDRVPEAEAILEQATLLKAHAAEAHLQLATLLVDRGEYERAIENLEESHHLNPRESVLTYLEAVRELAE